MRDIPHPAHPADGSRRSAFGPLGRIVEAWNRFWFSPTDPTTLGLVRLVAGFLILYVHLCYSSDLQAIFGRDAWMSQEMVNKTRHEREYYAPPAEWSDERVHVATGRYQWSMWFHVSDPGWMVAIHVTSLTVFFLFAIGFCTRVTSVLAFLLSLAYIQRAWTTLFGMDTISNILLLYLMIGPSGAAFSVDRLVARYRAARRAGYAGWFAPMAARSEPSVSANFALRLMQIHVCIIYFASGTSKLLGSTWWSGTAVWGTMANYEFSPMTDPLYNRMLTFLSQHRALWEVVVTSSVVFTLVMEIGFIFLVWNRRLRWVMLSGAVMLHMGIAFFMGLTMFSAMMLALLLAFVPAETIQRLLRVVGRRIPQVTMERLAGDLPRRQSVNA